MVDDEGSVERVLAAVETRKTDLIRFTSDIVRHDTSNPPGVTKPLVEFIVEYLSKRGFSPKVVESRREIQSVMCSVGGLSSASSSERSLVLCGHLDVVPPGDQNEWSVPPFSGKVAEGKVWGRGSADMKGGVAGILFAFLTAAEHLERSMQKGIVLALTADEEAGGDLGAKFLVKGGHVEGREAIIAEPTRFRKSGHVVVAGERGNLRTRVIFHGKPAHGSMPMLGENAVTKAMTQLNTSSGRRQVLGRVNPPHDARPLISEGRRVMKKEGSGGKKGRRRDSVENTMNHYTMNLGVINGGTRVNVVPDTCEVQFDLRLPLGGKREDGQKIIQKIAGKEPDIEFFGYSPPSYTPRNSSLVRSLRKVATKILGKDVPAVCSPYTTDAHHFRDGLNLDAVAFGPGYLDVIHNFNEYVDVNDVLNCCKVYAGYAAFYCSAL